VYLPSFPLLQRDGRPLELLPWLERAGSQTLTLSTLAQVVYQGQTIAVRVIAARLPRDYQGAALRRFRERARRKGREVRRRGELLATWLVIVTTLPAEAWTPQDVVALYRLRWQVELRIKRLKQLVTGSRLRARSAASGVALLWAQLVGWALHEATAAELRAPLEQDKQSTASEQGRPVEEGGTWQTSVLVLDTLRQALVGRWELARVVACLPRLRRYLVSRRGERVYQEAAAHAWLRGDRPGPGVRTAFV
jgi:hypothetical protein